MCRCLATSRQSSLIALGSEAGVLRLVDSAALNLTVVHRARLHHGPILHMKYSPDGSILAVLAGPRSLFASRLGHAPAHGSGSTPTHDLGKDSETCMQACSLTHCTAQAAGHSSEQLTGCCTSPCVRFLHSSCALAATASRNIGARLHNASIVIVHLFLPDGPVGSCEQAASKRMQQASPCWAACCQICCLQGYHATLHGVTLSTGSPAKREKTPMLFATMPDRDVAPILKAVHQECAAMSLADKHGLCKKAPAHARSRRQIQCLKYNCQLLLPLQWLQDVVCQDEWYP